MSWPNPATPTLYKGVFIRGCRHCGHNHWGECPEMRAFLDKETPEEFRDRLLSQQRAPIAWKGGKIYSHALARFPGDKNAYVSSAREAERKARKAFGEKATVEIRK